MAQLGDREMKPIVIIAATLFAVPSLAQEPMSKTLLAPDSPHMREMRAAAEFTAAERLKRKQEMEIRKLEASSPVAKVAAPNETPEPVIDPNFMAPDRVEARRADHLRKMAEEASEREAQIARLKKMKGVK
jgi:hypothetical protein